MMREYINNYWKRMYLKAREDLEEHKSEYRWLWDQFTKNSERS